LYNITVFIAFNIEQSLVKIRLVSTLFTREQLYMCIYLHVYQTTLPLLHDLLYVGKYTSIKVQNCVFAYTQPILLQAKTATTCMANCQSKSNATIWSFSQMVSLSFPLSHKHQTPQTQLNILSILQAVNEINSECILLLQEGSMLSGPLSRQTKILSEPVRPQRSVS